MDHLAVCLFQCAIWQYASCGGLSDSMYVVLDHLAVCMLLCTIWQYACCGGLSHSMHVVMDHLAVCSVVSMSWWTISQYAYCQDAITSGSLQYAYNYVLFWLDLCPLVPFLTRPVVQTASSDSRLTRWVRQNILYSAEIFLLSVKGKSLLLLRRANCGLFKSCLSAGHTPSIAFRNLPPNSARFGDTTQVALFISAQLSTDAVSALRKVWVLIWLWKQLSAPAPT